jgi:hypothetical protein
MTLQRKRNTKKDLTYGTRLFPISSGCRRQQPNTGRRIHPTLGTNILSSSLYMHTCHTYSSCRNHQGQQGHGRLKFTNFIMWHSVSNKHYIRVFFRLLFSCVLLQWFVKIINKIKAYIVYTCDIIYITKKRSIFFQSIWIYVKVELKLEHDVFISHLVKFIVIWSSFLSFHYLFCVFRIPLKMSLFR